MTVMVASIKNPAEGESVNPSFFWFINYLFFLSNMCEGDLFSVKNGATSLQIFLVPLWHSLVDLVIHRGTHLSFRWILPSPPSK